MAKKAPALTQAEQIIIDRARTSLAVYLGLVHMTEEGRQAIPPAHLLKYIIPAIQDDTLGNTVIVAPPGSIKTNTMMGACAWWLGRDPWIHLGYACNSGPRAQERSLVVRDLVERHGTYKQVFPDVEPDKSRGWAQDAWYLKRRNMTDKNPSFFATGTSGDVVGARIHRWVFDDLADDDNMKTELQRKYLLARLEQAYLTRMDDPTLGRAVMIGNRWHVEDPCGWAIDQGWSYVHIPAIDEDGESYWPQRWSRERLACVGEHGENKRCWFNPWKKTWEPCKKLELGTDGFARMYQGVVTNDETALFKRHNWRTYREIDLPKDLRGAIFVDLAHDEKTTSDYTVIVAIETDGARRFWRRLIRRRMQFPEAMLAVKEMRGQFPYYPVVVEDVSNSKPLIQQLQKEIGNIIAWKLEGRSKLARAEAASPAHEAGDWFLPEGAGWAGDVIEEHAQFPVGKHDDTVDCSSLQHLYFSRRISGVRRRLVSARPFARQWGDLSA